MPWHSSPSDISLEEGGVVQEEYVRVPVKDYTFFKLRFKRSQKEKEGTFLKKSAVLLSQKLKLKRYILPLFISLIATMVVTIYTWSADTAVNNLNNALNIFASVSGIMLLIPQAFSPDDDDYINTARNLETTQKMLTEMIDAKEKHDKNLKDMQSLIDVLTGVIKDFRNLGTQEFKEFMDSMKIDKLDKTKLEDITKRQRQLIDKLSKAAQEHEKIVSDRKLKEFAIKLDNFTSPSINQELEKSNLTSDTKELLLDLVKESKKVSEAYGKQLQFMRNFSFQRRRTSTDITSHEDETILPGHVIDFDIGDPEHQSKLNFDV